LWLGAGLLALVVFFVSAATGLVPVTAAQINQAAGYLQVLVVVPFFAWLLLDRSWTRDERHRLYAIIAYFVAAAVFWSVFEQAGSTLNLFADRSTRNEVLGHPFPSSWFQSLNALFIFILAPVFAWLWVKLGRRQPSTPAKFSLSLFGGVGLFGLGAGMAMFALTPRLKHLMGEVK